MEAPDIQRAISRFIRILSVDFRIEPPKAVYADIEKPYHGYYDLDHRTILIRTAESYVILHEFIHYLQHESVGWVKIRGPEFLVHEAFEETADMIATSLNKIYSIVFIDILLGKKVNPLGYRTVAKHLFEDLIMGHIRTIEKGLEMLIDPNIEHEKKVDILLGIETEVEKIKRIFPYFCRVRFGKWNAECKQLLQNLEMIGVKIRTVAIGELKKHGFGKIAETIKSYCDAFIRDMQEVI
jgi:hypothetical protein